MDTDSGAVISLESDEEMDTVAAPEAPTTAVTGEEPAAQEVPNNVETDATPSKSPDNAKNDTDDKDSDVILVDDEEKGTTERCEQKSPENLLPASEPAVEMNVSEPQTATKENEDVEMMEIAKEDDEKVPDCPQTVDEQQQKPEEMEEAQPAAAFEPDKQESAEIEAAVQSIQETKEPVLPHGNEPEEKLPDTKQRVQKCGNPGCGKTGLELIEAPVFAQSLYSMPPNKRAQSICPDCFQYS
uniref:Uncharacterized protein n=1 Tax=Anopheles maculatus TaxID=74869 RepID=A0A182SEF1_9DIPT